MDKYTVDLDKVLNDFEYSELTDNFSTARGYVPQSGANYASSSKSKTGEAKHSITNVFHSLNEYLNTDISTPNVNADNNAELAVQKHDNFNVATNSHIENLLDIEDECSATVESFDFVRNDFGNNHDNKSNVMIEKLVMEDFKIENAGVLDESKITENVGENGSLERGDVVQIRDITKTIEGVTEVSLEETKSVENFEKIDRKTDITKIPEAIEVTTVLKQIKSLEDEHTVEGYEKIDNPSLAITETVEIPKIPEGMTVLDTIDSSKVTNPVENIQETPQEIKLVENSTKTEENFKETEENDPIETFEDAEEIIEDIPDEPNPNLPAETLASNNLENALIENTEETHEKPVETINNNVTKTIEKPAEEKQKPIENSKTNESLEDNPKTSNKVVSFNDTFDIDDSTLNQYLDDLEVELGSEGVVEGDVKGGEDEKSSEETGNESVLTESETIELGEPIVDENKDIVQVEEIVEDNEDSLSRPKMLELSSSTSVDDGKREINLIGEPGSTPYNNIYVSKELQSEAKAEAQENASENSSVSPTFSEASTETVSDSSESDTDDPEIPTNVSVVSPKAVNVEEIACAGAEAGDSSTVGNASAVEEVDDENNVETPTNEAAQAEAEVAYWLGKQAPLWIPDSDAMACLHCDAKFTVIKRRHHCRACGLVLCSKCCNLKYRLEYLDAEARVCSKCHVILNRDTNSSSGSEISPYPGNSPFRQPNPNNPMEYCSVVPPMQQVGAVSQNPPTVMVPVGVLKRKGALKKTNKSVMFCDGIRPGSDLAKLDTDFNYVPKMASGNASVNVEEERKVIPKPKYEVPVMDPETKSFLPKNGQDLPPLVTVFKSETTYICNKYSNNEKLVDVLMSEKLTFALYKNIYVHVKIVDMSCCINKKAWCFTTEGFLSVGQDELVFLIEYIEDEAMLPMDIFHHLNLVYKDALKGTSVTELGLTLHDNSTFLDFKNHAGFLYIRPTFQCLQNIIKPTEPFLIGLLIHRWETPWAKIFPLRLVLRLGAEYRYYPSPIISTRHRDSVFVEIGHTIINLLADFRNFSYTLPSIRGLTIHMEEKNTTVTIPRNRYDQVIKSINNSSDHILAFGGNFSMQADSHLVCIQDTQSASENSYTTHAINIQNRPRKVTGASFIVFNGALKSTSGLTAKSSIVEDGLMIQIPAEEMMLLREHMRNMKTYTIQCGCVNAPSDETVNIVWGEPDNNFNLGVLSPIDNQSLSGVPSIRVHNGKDFICNSGNRLIRWTEVFIIQNTDHESKTRDPVDISKISESISKATCQALVKYLDLLSTNNFSKIALRTTLNVENVSYSAGSNNVKLPPIYMKSLDNELIPVLHRITSNNLNDVALILELVFRILNT